MADDLSATQYKT
ncbi:Protein of unknown function [Escherichia coli D6-113.11]|nr:Protein of unknown function [Escherichia coli D6-113.11]CDU36426.1 Protein of unknown function [Escherichia coli D6-113.11]